MAEPRPAPEPAKRDTRRHVGPASHKPWTAGPTLLSARTTYGARIAAKPGRCHPRHGCVHAGTSNPRHSTTRRGRPRQAEADDQTPWYIVSARTLASRAGRFGAAVHREPTCVPRIGRPHGTSPPCTLAHARRGCVREAPAAVDAAAPHLLFPAVLTCPSLNERGGLCRLVVNPTRRGRHLVLNPNSRDSGSRARRGGRSEGHKGSRGQATLARADCASRGRRTGLSKIGRRYAESVR